MSNLKQSTTTTATFSNSTSPLSANLSHKAFDLITLIDKLPLQIECMTCYDNMLILGTSCGKLLVYEIKINELTPSKFELDVKRSITATKKPILQLEALRAFDIIIALFDAQLHVFDLDKFQLQYSINKTKGCSLFTTSISNDQKLLRLCVACKKKLQFFYINILSKNTSQFMELVSDLELNDIPRNLKLTKDNLVVFSLRKDYYYYEMPSTSVNAPGSNLKQPETRFSIGSRQIEPLCEKLQNEYFALGVDENKTIIYDTKGKPNLEYPILWSNTPSAVCSVGPYLIGILPALNSLEIVTIQPTSVSVQLIEFNRESISNTNNTESRSISSSFSSSFIGQAVSAPVLAVTNTVSNLTSSLTSNQIQQPVLNINPADRIKVIKSNNNSVCYVATQSYVWCLIPIKINDQLEQVLRYKNYELGLNLISTQLNFNQTNECPFAKSWPTSTTSPKQNISKILLPFFSFNPLENEVNEITQRKIKNLNALDLFCRKKFTESLQLFQNMKTDPSHIIAFLPGLLPDAYRSKLKFDEYYPVLDAKEMEDAIGSLIDYLQVKRNEFLKESKQINDPTNFNLIPLIEGKPVLKTRQQILQIIDTTLLKCYLKTKENLVPFFLRREQNFLHLDESERLLTQHNKISELIILYEKKEAHEKALNLLLAELPKQNSVLYGVKHLVEYLKKIGNANLELTFKFAKNVIETDAKWGIKIFMGDAFKVDKIIAERAKVKQKNLIRKKKSVSTLKSVIKKRNDSKELSNLLKINTNQDEESDENYNFEMIEDDDDEEEFKLLDHEQVCKYLSEQIEPKSLSINLARIYVQYCIFVWADKNPKLNNILIDFYVLLIEQKQSDKLEEDQIKTYKEMLIYFLTETNNYEAIYAISKLSLENYPEERAIVLGKLGKHSEALTIYVDKLNDIDKAEAYCHHVFASQDTVEAKQVYYQLLQIYLNSDYEEIRIGASIRLLNAHSNEIGSCRSLELLPAELMKCKNLSPFFENMLNRLARNKHNIQIINRLMFSLELQIHETKILCQDKKFVVNDEQMCKECNKRMGKSAMVRFPNGDLIHYGCSKNSESYAKRSSVN